MADKKASKASAESPPSTTGDSGRLSNGRFGAGNRFGRGNPLARRACRLRAELFRTTTPADIRDIALRMIEKAKDGDSTAAKLLLDRLFGPPESFETQQRVSELEQRVGELTDALRDRAPDVLGLRKVE